MLMTTYSHDTIFFKFLGNIGDPKIILSASFGEYFLIKPEVFTLSDQADKVTYLNMFTRVMTLCNFTLALL